MALKNQDFELYQGDDKIIDFHILNGQKLDADLSGNQFEWQMIITPISSLSKSTQAGNIIISNSHVQIIFDSIDSINKIGKYSHELRVTDIYNKTQVVATGCVSILTSSTR